MGGINAPVQISKVQERQESGKNLMNTVLGEGKRKKNPRKRHIRWFSSLSLSLLNVGGALYVTQGILT